MSTEEQVKKRWQKKGFSFGVFVDPPGQKWENFSHPTDELFMLFFGEIEIEIAGKILHPKHGEEVFIPARTLHSVRNIGKSENKWFYGYNE